MAERKDAGVTLVRLVAAIDRTLRRDRRAAHGVDLRPHRVRSRRAEHRPGRARAMFQFRDADPAILQRLEAALHELVADFNEAGPCTIAVDVDPAEHAGA